MKTIERQRARELRAEGCSVKEIERMLGVARSSVSRWVRDVKLGPEQRRALVARTREGPLIAGERKAAAARLVRSGYQQQGRVLARRGEPSFVAGCMLYWAEGDKARNRVGMSNADDRLLAFFAAFLRRHFDVPDVKFRVHCNLFADHLDRQREVEQFWLSTLGVTETSLCKSAVNVYSKYSQKKRINMLPYGTCKLVVHNTEIAQTILGAIQEFGSFERPEWLD